MSEHKPFKVVSFTIPYDPRDESYHDTEKEAMDAVSKYRRKHFYGKVIGRTAWVQLNERT